MSWLSTPAPINFGEDRYVCSLLASFEDAGDMLHRMLSRLLNGGSESARSEQRVGSSIRDTATLSPGVSKGGDSKSLKLVVCRGERQRHRGRHRCCEA